MLHGVSYSELKSSRISKLSPLQSHLLNQIVPEEKDREAFLNSDLSSLPSPFLLPDMENSVKLIKKHIQMRSHILLYGDRDTDGVSSTALLGIFFRDTHEINGGRLTIKTSSEKDDYGLCPSVMKFISNAKPNLLITLDFGSSNYSEINELAEQGIDIIVLDHHEIPLKIPKCSLVNPKREDSIYAEKRICTSALAMKLIMAMRFAEKYDLIQKENGSLFSDGKYSNIPTLEYTNTYGDICNYYMELLDLSSIGTITDMMPLVGENRIMVKYGIISLQNVIKGENKNRKGLYYLYHNLKLNPSKIFSKDLGWSLGPALNAAGRMGKSEISLELLLCREDEQANKISKELLGLNKERKERTKRNLDRVNRYFERKPDRKEGPISFCYEPDMEPGVSGIVATKLVETYKKPAIFITPDNGQARGSIRSHKKENVLDLLNKYSDILIHFGGHPEAGGFSIEPEKIPEFYSRLTVYANDWLSDSLNSLSEEKSSVVSFNASELSESIFEEISIFEPFGHGNQNPIISIKNAKIINYKPLSDGQHGRFSALGVSPKIKFVIWNFASEFEKQISSSSSIDIWGYLEENYFNSSTSIQFVVTHFQ